MTAITIYSRIPHAGGWGPILHMQNLMAHLLDGTLTPVPSPATPRLARAAARLVPARKAAGASAASPQLYLVTHPGEVADIVPTRWRPRRGAPAALWIVDSFRTALAEWAAPVISRHFDLVVYMQAYDAPVYERLFGARALHLGWGSDVLGLGSGEGARPVDVLRVGRQPPGWDDDAATGQACAAAGLRFAGRPPRDLAPLTQQRALLTEHYARAKFVLASSNLRAPASYTHATKEYVTGRWTDALAAGATVAGMAPETDVDAIDWPGALLRFRDLALDTGLATLREAAQSWSPETARRNHRMALERLDWRWRFDTLARRLGIAAPALDAALADLRARLDGAASTTDAQR